MSFAFKIPDQHLASPIPWDLAASSLNGSPRAAHGGPSLGSEAQPRPSTRAPLPSSGLVQVPVDPFLFSQACSVLTSTSLNYLRAGSGS